MAFRTRLNLHRAVLMVAVGASARRGNVLRMVERHRFVDVGQAAQCEILRKVLPGVVSLAEEIPNQSAMATTMIGAFFMCPVSFSQGLVRTSLILAPTLSPIL